MGCVSVKNNAEKVIDGIRIGPDARYSIKNSKQQTERPNRFWMEPCFRVEHLHRYEMILAFQCQIYHSSHRIYKWIDCQVKKCCEKIGLFTKTVDSQYLLITRYDQEMRTKTTFKLSGGWRKPYQRKNTWTNCVKMVEVAVHFKR